MEGNNINGNIAFLRDTFLEAEREYLDELKKDPQYRMVIEDLNKFDSEKLAYEAMRRIKNIEAGQVKKSSLERVETEITVLLAAIQDHVREIGEREKMKEVDEEEPER